MNIPRNGPLRLVTTGALVLVAIVQAAQCRADAAGDAERSVAVGGLKRTYFVHEPAIRKPGQPLALVVVFHGGGGNARNAARMSGMNARADREGFLVAYPDGTGPIAGALLTWNAWICCGYALDNHVDDAGFVRALVDALAHDYPVDRKRIYATGLSNGGMMTYRVGCDLADVFAAIAPVAGALNTDECRPAAPVSVIIFHGTADQHVRFDGGAPTRAVDVRHPRVDKPVSFAVDFWKRNNHCDASATTETRGHVQHTSYACGGAAVELYAIEGQGHAWPGGEKGIRAGNVDAPTTEISASDLMWDFFARHPKK